VKPALIEEGFYYEKANSKGWLRHVIRIESGRVIYTDFTRIGACDIESFARWASRRLTKVEACIEFTDEFMKIAKIEKALKAGELSPIITGLGLSS